MLVSKLTTRVTSQALNWEILFFTYMVFFLIEPHWFFISGGKWRKLPRKVSYKCTFVVPNQGQTLGVWESQTTKSALRWWTRHIAPHHILELTLEVNLEVILEHVLGIMTMTSLILDHVATAYLYLGINTREKVMILFVVIVLELSQDSSWLNMHAPRYFFCRPLLSLIIFILVSQTLLLNYSCNTCSLNTACSMNLACLLEVGLEA